MMSPGIFLAADDTDGEATPAPQADAPAAADGGAAPETGTATTGADGGTKPMQEEAPPSLFGGNFLFIMIAMFVVMWFLMIRPQKKRERERKALLSQIGKGSKVRTIGGIFGEVVISKDDYVVIKVDEKTGSTMKVARRAVSGVTSDDDSESEE
jgi:preprotein translocase subunit YajC